MTDKDLGKAIAAFHKGYNDSNKDAKLTAIQALFTSYWDPPPGYEEEYREGWKAAEKDRASGKGKNDC
jgi:hypothetical protein